MRCRVELILSHAFVQNLLRIKDKAKDYQHLLRMTLNILRLKTLGSVSLLCPPRYDQNWLLLVTHLRLHPLMLRENENRGASTSLLVTSLLLDRLSLSNCHEHQPVWTECVQNTVQRPTWYFMLVASPKLSAYLHISTEIQRLFFPGKNKFIYIINVCPVK